MAANRTSIGIPKRPLRSDQHELGNDTIIDIKPNVSPRKAIKSVHRSALKSEDIDIDIVSLSKPNLSKLDFNKNDALAGLS
jgi:hypothetical protein